MKKDAIDDKLHWYKDAIIYELHIKAFRDGNCDGIGDFVGLMEKLDYLQNLGVTAIWLLPFYPSPLKDDGYDIANYYSINPNYGSIAHFKKLLKEAHKRKLKVITELVINHTSDQHPWFQKARKAPKGSAARNFYVWTDNPEQYADARIIFQDFEKSNWTWDPIAQQYYWHRFFHHQPDLNYDNPAVQEEVFKILDFWCEMGVDGFRLDAVPYLFEREGTNCENLPETHAFLKKLRKHVDEKYPGTLLLAEANMWPEDSASYFGNGDECQMNYHFPVMPRMFMAIKMEDRYPITDIYDQTPAIPDICQWGIFLRNHDELTLEMVTDEERDYMYRVYVKDPQARINLGIRHRLAPLMENDRRKIELLNYLLFSLPGTPVIYYGDEIGMGDNYYLGDRDGVRTPMQWSLDRNAGFSEANPQRLYLPIVLDPLYHYEYVNVEVQNRNSSSLLWAMKKLISTRKRYLAFSRGDIKFIASENPKVLSFIRSYGDENILVIVNLSRFSQPVELDLSEYKGQTLTEMFSYNNFPQIKAASPYFFTMAPYECLWFEISSKEMVEDHPQHILEFERWPVFTDDAEEMFVDTILPAYLNKMRWFGGKARNTNSIDIVNLTTLAVADSHVVMMILEVTYKSELPERYQLSLAFASGEQATKIADDFPNAVVCNASVKGTEGILYDALYSDSFRQYIFERLAERHKESVNHIVFSANRGLKNYARNHNSIKSRILSAEQSNSSIVYDNAYFLKIYRKVDNVANPDVEITEFLTESTDFRHLPAFVGTIEWDTADGNIILGMVQEMVESNIDGWTFMLDRLKSYNEKILAAARADELMLKFNASQPPYHFDELPVQVKELLEPAVVERITQLGIRTGELHLALASVKDIPEFSPEPFSLHYQRSLFSSFQSQVRSAYQSLQKNIKKLPPEIQAEAEEVLGLKDKVLERFRSIYSKKFEVIKVRVHGDYHLGQTLFTGKDIVILDFEGEPGRSYSERRIKRNALKDVAGMIRSFHYAAYGNLFLNNNTRKEDLSKLMPFAEQWHKYMSDLYLQTYLKTVSGSKLVPGDIEDVKTLMDVYILEKAIYELNYELNNRPNWVTIPLRGIKSIIQQ